MADTITSVSTTVANIASLLATTTTAGIYKVTITDIDSNGSNIIINSSATAGSLGYILKNNITTGVYFDFSSVDLTKATTTSFDNAFEGCTNLYAIGNFGTNTLTTANAMFSGCSSLVSVNISALSSVIDVDSMFAGCSALVTITVCTAFIANNKAKSNLFKDCTLLKSILVSDATHPAVIAKDTDIQGNLVVRKNQVIQGNLTVLGNMNGSAAGEASKLSTARTITVTSATDSTATGSASFDGTADATINLSGFVSTNELATKIATLKNAAMVKVDSLPTTGEEGIIYLVAKSSTDAGY